MDNFIPTPVSWYIINNVEEVSSPSLLVYPGRIEMNIQRMISTAGDAGSLRPHIKTHKMAEVAKLLMKYGIHKFKCSTIAEAEMVALCGASDILLAYQPVGPNIGRFFRLMQEFPEIKFSCIADSEEVIRQLSVSAENKALGTHVWLDINNGMNRTGVVPGEDAAILYKMICSLPKLNAEGLHIYDGHIHESDFNLRKILCDEAFKPVTSLIDELKRSGTDAVQVIAGGSPTFPVHARRHGAETSPGTTVLWDYGYSSSFSDMDFLHAAVLLTRVVSKPGKDLICIDLGHKAVASEMPQPRIKIMGIEDYAIISHNEEHMVIRTTKAINLKTGDPLYAIPYHICPTVDRYDSVSVVKEMKVTEEWEVKARKRRITI